MAEAKFGILIEGQDRATPAFDSAIRKDEELIRTVERLIAVSERTAQSTQFVSDTLKFAAEETARLSDEQKRLAEETARAEEASKKAAAAAQAEAAARRRQREEIFEWTVAVASAGAALVAASDRAGDYQEKVELITQATGLSAREQGALSLAASNIGRSYEQATPAIDIFVRKLGEARDELRRGEPGEAVAAFDATGIVGGLDQSTGALLEEIGQKLSAIQDPAERSRVAFELFGRSFQTIVPIITQDLSDLADEAERSGRVFSEAMEETARDADIQGDRIKGAIEGITNQLSVGLAGGGGNSIKSFLADASEGFAEFLTFVNKSNEELGHFRINLTDPRYARGVSFQPGRILDEFRHGTILGTAYSNNPVFNQPGMPTDAQMQQAQDIARQAAAAEKVAGDLAKELADAKRSWAEAAESEAGIPTPWGWGPRAARTGLARPNTKGEVGDRFTPATEWEGNLGDDIFRASKQTEAFERGLATLANTMKGGVSDGVSDLILGFGSLERAIDSLLDSIVRQGVDLGVNAFFGLFGLQGGHDPGTAMNPIYAQSGVVVSGVRGADAAHAMLGRDETVLDHGLTDNLRSLLRDLRSGSVSTQQGTYVTNVIHPGAIQYHGIAANLAELEEFNRDRVWPDLRTMLQRGAG